jgi:SNF2 family DNA or RNA helicase
MPRGHRLQGSHDMASGDRAVVTARLDGGQPAVLLERDHVADDVWAEIAVTLADRLPRPSKPIAVAPERLVARRRSFAGILRRNQIDFQAKDGVTELLQAANSDQEALQELLDQAVVAPAADVSCILPQRDSSLRVVRPLRSFQERDLARLQRMRHGANLSVPGAGKTTVAYALHASERAAGRVDKLLVVAPLSAFNAWEEEAPTTLNPAPAVTRWRGGAVNGDVDVLLVNYQRLPSALVAVGAWMQHHRIHLVVDEAHRAKRGSLGEWGRALLALAPLAARRDILTGTPAPNHPRDLVALLDILWPGGAASRALPASALRTDPPSAAMDAVNRVIQPLYVRTTKAELQLPDVTVMQQPVDLGPLQQAIYDAMLSRYAGMLALDRRDAAMFAQMGEVVMYLLQAASSPRLLTASADPGRAYRFPPLAIPAGSALARMVEDYADHEVPTKIEQACRIVHSNAALDPPRKTLVWSNFPDNLLDLEQQLAALQPAVIYGAVRSDADADPGVRTRERELARFRYDPDCLVLLANPAALAEGVSLHHTCHDAVYVDRTFNAGQYLQSLDRIHRLGLRPDAETRIYLLTARGTIDERVQRRVEEKMRRLARMLDDPSLVNMALPDDEDFGGVIDDEADLDEILRHLAEGMPTRVGSDG